MKMVIDVNTGGVRVSNRGVILRSTAVGSCVVVAAYEAGRGIGGLAHIMLPGAAPRREKDKTKYAANAIAKLSGKMGRLGARMRDVQACLVGAANVLKEKNDTICRQNIASVTDMLGRRKIRIKARAVGGTKRRSIALDVETGRVNYTEGEGAEKVLWKFRRTRKRV